MLLLQFFPPFSFLPKMGPDYFGSLPLIALLKAPGGGKEKNI